MVTDTAFRKSSLEKKFFLKAVVLAIFKHWPYHTDVLIDHLAECILLW